MVATQMAEPVFFETSDLAREFGVARETVVSWDRAGLIGPAARTPGGRRIYTKVQVEEIRRQLQERQAARVAGCELQTA